MVHPRSWQGHDDPYRALGVDTGASRQDIARAYRRAAQRAHPDTQPQDPQAIARFQALTDAYDLLSDPGRRADYDRGHPAAEPSGQRPRPGQPAAASRWRGSLIWAGPVHVEPPATAPGTSQHRRSTPAADFEDPVVILGPLPGQVWGWPW
jgi:curved DNA-binding protein CbpA